MKCKKCKLSPMMDGSTVCQIAEYRCLRCQTSCEVDLKLDEPYKDENIAWDFSKTCWD